MNKTKIPLVLTLCLIWLGLSSASVAADNANPSEEPPSWLFVQEAASGTLKGPDDQHLTLTLKRVRDYTTGFTDRPYRDAVDIPTQTFIGAWDTAFANYPPNASLSYRLPGQARPQTLILELTTPTYDAKKSNVSYQAKLVHTAARPFDAPLNSRAIKVPTRFSSPSLFIDDGACFARGGCGFW